MRDANKTKRCVLFDLVFITVMFVSFFAAKHDPLFIGAAPLSTPCYALYGEE